MLGLLLLSATRVLGFYPDWEKGQAAFNWDVLTDVAVAFVDVSDTGAVTGADFWRSQAIGDVAADAHGQGARLVLAARNFDGAAIHRLLGSEQATQAAVAALVSEALVSQAGDGLCLDFEGVAGHDRALFVQFVTEVAAALRQARPGAELFVAVPAVDFRNAFDLAALASSADGLFVMAYDYSYAKSPPGPVAPLASGSPWPPYDVTATLEDALGRAAPAKLLLGMPLYGYDFPSSSGDPGASATGTAQAIGYARARTAAAAAGRRWDAMSQTPWYVYQAQDGTHQVWYEDEQSLGLKIDLARRTQILGVGVWALGYEDESFWQMARERLDAPIPMGGGCQIASGRKGGAAVAVAVGLFILGAGGRTRRSRRARAFG